MAFKALLNAQQMRDTNFVAWVAALYLENVKIERFEEQILLIICVAMKDRCSIPKVHIISFRLGPFFDISISCLV